MQKKDSMQNKKAVALWYPKGAKAPFLTAKVNGYLADRIVKLAKECNVPIVQDKQALEVVSIAEIGQCIPVEAYQAVAAVFTYLRTI